MSGYPRSVIFRFVGAIAGTTLFLGLIVLALTNFDTPASFPEEFQATWPFWLITLGITVAVFFVRRRLGPGPGWGSYAIGLLAPFFGLLVNARTGSGMWFWVIVVALVVVPLPNLRRSAEI